MPESGLNLSKTTSDLDRMSETDWSDNLEGFEKLDVQVSMNLFFVIPNSLRPYSGKHQVRVTPS